MRSVIMHKKVITFLSRIFESVKEDASTILRDIENASLLFWGASPLGIYIVSSFIPGHSGFVVLVLLCGAFLVAHWPDYRSSKLSGITPFWVTSTLSFIKFTILLILLMIGIKATLGEVGWLEIFLLAVEGGRWFLIDELNGKNREFTERAEGEDEIYLGKMENGDPVFIPDDQSRCAHTLMTGPTGIGKTFAAMSPLVHHDIKTNKHVVIIDYKGDLGFLNSVYTWTKDQGREFILVDTLKPEYSHPYNPFADGNADITKEKMVAAKVWSEVHYKDISTDALLEACIELYSKKSSVTMADVLPYLERSEDTSGIASFLRSLLNSSAGYIFTSDPNVGAKEFFKRNAVVYYRCPAELSPELSKQLARLILSDYKELSALQKDVPKNKQHPISIFVDEAPKFINAEFDDFLTMARSANIRVHILTQGILAFLKLGKDFISTLLDNTQYKFLMNSTSPEATDILSKSIGTKEVEIKTYQMASDIVEKKTGVGSIRTGRELIIHSDVLKHLRKGEMVLSCDLNNRQEKLYLDNFLYRDFELRDYFADEEKKPEFHKRVIELHKYKRNITLRVQEKNIKKKEAESRRIKRATKSKKNASSQTTLNI